MSGKPTGFGGRKGFGRQGYAEFSAKGGTGGWTCGSDSSELKSALAKKLGEKLAAKKAAKKAETTSSTPTAPSEAASEEKSETDPPSGRKKVLKRKFRKTTRKVYTYGLPFDFVKALRAEVRDNNPYVTHEELDAVTKRIAQNLPWVRLA